MTQPATAPVGPRPWYHVGPVVAAAADPDKAGQADSKTADVYIYDVLGGFWGLSADDFVRDVADLDVDHIVLHLNTPGGEVSEGVAIANMLRQHRADVRVMVDGMAASSGSVVAMAGDEIVMGLGSQMMVHTPRTWAVGDPEEMTKVVRMLESTADAIASTYAAKAGGTVAEWREIMRAETWYTADEAVKAGLADRIATDDDKGTATGRKVTPGAKTGFWDLWDSLRDQGRLDLSAFHYRYQGRQNAPAPNVPARGSVPSPTSAAAALAAAAETVRPIRAAAGKSTPIGRQPTTETGQEASMDAAKIREALGLATDAPDAAVREALVRAGLATATTEPVPTPVPEPTPPPTPPTPEPAPEPAPPRATGALPPGMRLIADSAWQAQQDRIKRLEAREAKRERDERDQIVAQAVKDGKFTPAQRDHFAKLWDADPEGTRALIASLTKGVALGTEELGHSGEDDIDAEFTQFDGLYPPHQRLAGKGASSNG